MISQEWKVPELGGGTRIQPVLENAGFDRNIWRTIKLETHWELFQKKGKLLEEEEWEEKKQDQHRQVLKMNNTQNNFQQVEG